MLATAAAAIDRTDPDDFVAPGPGSWEQDAAHWPRPVTPWTATLYPPGFRRALSEGMRRFGLLLSHLEYRAVHGFLYLQPVPAVDPQGGPDARRQLLERLEAAERAIAGRIRREDLDEWDRTWKPDSVRRNTSLQDEDPATLGDAALARHLERAAENHAEMCYRHHRWTIPAVLPVGLYLTRAQAWTGRPNGELLALLAGASPVSGGTAATELAEVGRALAAEGLDLGAMPGEPACVLERLRRDPGPVGAAVRRYLAACGLHVASGYDITERTVGELPEIVLRSFASARDEHATFRAGGDLARREAEVRAAVPAEHRAGFDDLLAEARRIYRLRDERGIYNDLWSAGIARRAVLEAGRRLALRGRLDDAELLFEATPEEMVERMRGHSRPSGAELAQRASRRLGRTWRDVPRLLGGQPPAPPDLSGLPPAARATAEAIGLAIDEILGNAAGGAEPYVVTGRGAGAGSYVGRARIVKGPADFDRLRHGDVLVTVSTSASFNVVLRLVGAIVTDRGGLLSHAAIVAREYGLPAVVGTLEATARIPDGAPVRVDGSTGRVEVLR